VFTAEKEEESAGEPPGTSRQEEDLHEGSHIYEPSQQPNDVSQQLILSFIDK